MKVCDLTQFYSPYSGGVKRYLQEKVSFIRRARPEDRHILVVPGAATEKKEEGLATVYTIASPLISRNSRYRILSRLHLVEEILERELPDIIESGDPYQLAWKAVASGRGLDIPVVGFYHSHFPEAYIRTVAKYFGPLSVALAEDISERYLRALYNRFERTLVPSPALAEVLSSWGLEHVETIELGVDTGVFFPDAERGAVRRAELGITEDRTFLLYVGRLAPEKNIPVLLAAFQQLEQSCPGEFQLVIAGDGPQRRLVQKLAAESRNVTLVGYVTEVQQLADLYRAADLFVHPSLHETFGLVAVESQACGTPVVGIRGSYMERVIFSDHALLAETNTPEALAAAIRKSRVPELRPDGMRASRIVRSLHSWEQVFTHLFSVYEKVIRDYMN